MSEKEVVMDRDEFTRYLIPRLEKKTDVGRYIGFIEEAFILQNDIGRPAYVFSVSRTMTQTERDYLEKIMQELGCISAFVPKDMIKYEGTLTPESMNVKNIKTIMYDRKPYEEKVESDGGQNNGIGNDNRGERDSQRGNLDEGCPSGDKKRIGRFGKIKNKFGKNKDQQ